MTSCFGAYERALSFWEKKVTEKPELARIPSVILSDASDKAQKQVARMKRNYAFDRARYFLPVAALTNMMMVMSARGWMQLCQHLLSHWLPECVALGEKIREELKLSAPRMVKHAEFKRSFAIGQKKDFLNDIAPLRTAAQEARTASIDVMPPLGVLEADLVASLSVHDNRYAFIESAARRTAVRFSWPAVSMAEIRDFNRHRTGQKYCPLFPVGFYAADDQLSGGDLNHLREIGEIALKVSRERAYQIGNVSFAGWILLGHQFKFEHTTTLDKFVYEAELRTGTGAHYRYADHIRDAVAELSKSYPLLAKAIKLGTSEPE